MMTVRYQPKNKNNNNNDDDNSLKKKNFEKKIEKIIIDNNNNINNNNHHQTIDDDNKTDDSSLRSSQVTIKISDSNSFLKKDDFLEFIQIRNFSEGRKSFISSPRASHVQISDNDFIHLLQYEDVKKWFENNISGYLKKKERWSRHIYPERLLYIYGPRGMGRLTLTLLLCNDAQVNLIFVPSSIHDTSIYLKLIKKAKEMQPCLIFFDDFDPVLGFDPCLNALYANMNSQMNKRDDDIWIFMTGITPPENLSPSSKCMVSDYGSITDVNAIEDEQQAQELIMKMLTNISRARDYPCSFEDLIDPYNQWSNTMNLLSRYARYCTIKELDSFFIKLFRNYHQQVKDDSASYLPTLEVFNQVMDEIPFVDDRSDTRSIATSRKAADDYQKHENEWKLYVTVSGIKSTPRPNFSPSSPANTFLPRHLSTPGTSAMYPQPPMPSSVSREEQRNLEREKRRQQRVHAETETILQSGYDFSGLSAPCQQTQPTSNPYEKPLGVIRKDSQLSFMPSSPSSIRRPFLPPCSSSSSMNKKNDSVNNHSPSIAVSSHPRKESSLIQESTPKSSYRSLSSPSHSIFDEDSNDIDGRENDAAFQEISKEIESSSLPALSPSSTPHLPQQRLISDKPTLPRLSISQFKKRPLPSSSSKKTTSTSTSTSASQNFLKRLRV